MKIRKQLHNMKDFNTIRLNIQNTFNQLIILINDHKNYCNSSVKFEDWEIRELEERINSLRIHLIELMKMDSQYPIPIDKIYLVASTLTQENINVDNG